MSSPLMAANADSALDIESGRPVDLSPQQSSWIGRQVRKIPTSFEKAAAGAGAGGVSIGVICLIVGGSMWGGCHNGSDCQNVGQIITWIGVGLTGLSCLCGCVTGCIIACMEK